ncbi:unnamed protein product [Arctia plantaginis]|uniref:Gustatory receptor n=1 Tax=Arctia plantaginis TaxID=874455 RepID=A0A8S0YL45_ARCPL|nr:unnamed protein product [Arctia plantaginis]
MDLVTPPHPECTVSGIMSFILRLSRVAGVAPLKFTSTPDGYRIQVSHNYSLYGEAVVLLFVAISIVAVVMDLTIYKDFSLKATTNANRIVWITDVGIVSLVVIIGAYTGVKRMRYMIDTVVELKQVDEELKKFRKPTYINDRKTLLSLTALTFSIGIVFTDYGYFMYKVIMNNGKILTSSLYVFYAISCIKLELLVIQFTLTSMLILATLMELNNCFDDILLEMQKNKSVVSKFTVLYTQTVFKKKSTLIKSNRVTQEIFDQNTKLNEGNTIIAKKLNQLVRLYGSMSDIIDKVEKSNGILLVVLLLSFLLHLVIAPYHLLNGIAHPERNDLWNVVLQVPYAILHFGKLVMVVEPCHQTHDELDNTKNMIAHLMRYIRHDDFELITEIKTFFRHLNLNQGLYAPMKLFTLNRSIIVAVSIGLQKDLPI